MKYYEVVKKPEGKDDNKGDKKDGSGKKDEPKVTKMERLNENFLLAWMKV